MRHGVYHWWAQRITAVLLAPLTLWIAFALATLPLDDHAATVQWIGASWHPVAMALAIFAVSYHSQLGVQVVIEDYVHAGSLRSAALGASLLAHFGVAAAALYALARIAGGATP
jgi:succinate dehydrogenase / fumarate reductase membrane anchor subunit